MRIGSSIALIALGLILAVAVNFDLDGIDLQQVGWILVLVGTVGLVISVVLMRRSRPVIEREIVAPPSVPDPRYPDRRSY